jgi:hypothetical protein
MITFEKGEETPWEDIIIKEGGEFNETDLVSVCWAKDPYYSAAEIQANFIKYGVFVFRNKNG